MLSEGGFLRGCIRGQSGTLGSVREATSAVYRPGPVEHRPRGNCGPGSIEGRSEEYLVLPEREWFGLGNGACRLGGTE